MSKNNSSILYLYAPKLKVIINQNAICDYLIPKESFNKNIIKGTKGFIVGHCDLYTFALNMPCYYAKFELDEYADEIFIITEMYIDKDYQYYRNQIINGILEDE